MKMAKQSPGSNLGQYLHPKKGSKINSPIAKPLTPTAQRIPSTLKAPMKIKIGKGKK